MRRVCTGTVYTINSTLITECKVSLTAFLVLRGVSLPRATAFDPFGAGLAIACFLNSSCGVEDANKSINTLGRLEVL